jgi:hypothetical protein
MRGMRVALGQGVPHSANFADFAWRVAGSGAVRLILFGVLSRCLWLPAILCFRVPSPSLLLRSRWLNHGVAIGKLASASPYGTAGVVDPIRARDFQRGGMERGLSLTMTSGYMSRG